MYRDRAISPVGPSPRDRAQVYKPRPIDPESHADSNPNPDSDPEHNYVKGAYFLSGAEVGVERAEAVIQVDLLMFY